jgi:SNF2 family DNA or RNA helicase
VQVVSDIATMLEAERVNFIKIDGQTKTFERGDLVDTFQSDPECTIALLSIATSGTGLTLTAAKMVCHGKM